MLPFLVVLPIAYIAYTSGEKSAAPVETKQAKRDEDQLISYNNWIYLEDPLLAPKVLPGDNYEYTWQNPMGPIQGQMQANNEDPVKALAVLGTYEAMKDRHVLNLWRDFAKPRYEITTRSVDAKPTLVNILQPGGAADQNVHNGVRFWDQPVPRSTGIDRYYPRIQTVPWYLQP